MNDFILPLRQVDGPALGAGGKATALARLIRLGFKVPNGFVVLPHAFNRVREIRAEMEAELDAAMIARGTLPEVLTTLLEQAFANLQADSPAPHSDRPSLYAVRSSGADEDGAEHSFAGQFESFLGVARADVAAKIVAVWASGFSPRSRIYRAERGLSALASAPAVLVQQMVDADAAGVAFSADPVSARRGVAVVSSVWGLGQGLVSGEMDADLWHVDRTGSIVLRRPATKPKAWRLARIKSADDEASPPVPVGDSPLPESLNTDTIPADQGPLLIDNDPVEADMPSLGDAEICAIAALARESAREFDAPQDIEWAVAGGTIYLLQSRPITSLKGRHDPDGVRILWDNSNIAESYSGVTSPLTFSFARHVYEHVYREFCRLLRVAPSRIAGADSVFREMLGSHRGRVFYNLVNWHRVLALLPGYQFNRAFMEQMMGVREPLPADMQPGDGSAPGRLERWRDLAALVGTVLALVRSHLALDRTVAAFQVRLKDALGSDAVPLEELRADELAQAYSLLEEKLLRKWDAPLLNDFFAMIFFGLLRALSRKWLPEEGDSVPSRLVQHESGIVSAEPARLAEQMAKILRAQPELLAVWKNDDGQQILRRTRGMPPLHELLSTYLERFGDRCVGELKLETIPFSIDPTPLARSVARLAENPVATSQPRPKTHEAEESARHRLRHSGIRRGLFNFVLTQARRHIQLRENLRLERTRLFGRVRRIFRALGRRFEESGLLADRSLIFHLTIEEALGLVRGTGDNWNATELARARRAQAVEFETNPPPPDRFITIGAVADGCHAPSSKVEEAPGDGASGTTTVLAGLGSCPGRVRGRARIIRNPASEHPLHGEIMIAERTDPGWVLLFPMAAGLVVQYGSLLSHSAIVARELGLPAVVGVPGLLGLIKTGDLLELDGEAGTVKVVERATTSSGTDAN